MDIVRNSSADDYIVSFWTREKRKNGEFPPPENRLETLLAKYPYKFPCHGKQELKWHICRVSSTEDLEQLWMHKSGSWLEHHNLWHGSHWLKDLARTAIDTRLFARPDAGSCRDNYHRWKNETKNLEGQLSGHENPLL